MRPGGRIAGYVIHTVAGLSAAAEQRVVDLMPMAVLADGSPAELAERAGFSVVTCVDVTDPFRATSEAILRARAEHEAELRAVDGNEAYEDDQLRKDSVRTGIDEGLLERSLIAAVKD